MEKRTALVTGASSGLGFYLAVLLAERGWSLILLNRRKVASQSIVKRITAANPKIEVEVFEADLADRDSLSKAVESITLKHSRIDALFNNAGVLLGDLTYSKHNTEMHFQVNTLAPYMLMQLLRPQLSASKHSSVVNVSSGAIAMTGKLRIEELRQPPQLQKLFGAYAQSKLALTTLTNALAPEYQKEGIILRSVDPGGSKTRMTASSGMPRLLTLLRPLFFQSPMNGAKAIYDAAFNPKFDNQSGIFIVSSKIASPPRDALDSTVQSSLLVLCQDLTGV
jgi:NAD(P)-dependent dehydrogenase (short-subunit alcohol dehydrogenase family)